MRNHLAAALVGIVYYTAGFLAFWVAAAPYSRNLGTDAFADGIWAELFPYWVVGQIGLTVWATVNALALPRERHRALAAGLGAGLLSLAGIVILGFEDSARVWLDVIGIAAGIAIGVLLDRVAAGRTIRMPAAWHLVWLWIPGAAFLASGLVLINAVVVAQIVDHMDAETLWLLIPLAGGAAMVAGWWRLAQARTRTTGRIAVEISGAVLVVAGAAAPALITGFVFRGLFLRQVVGL